MSTNTELDHLRDRIVARVSGVKERTFKSALKNHVFERWAKGKRIRGVYLGACAWRGVNLRAIIATDGTVQAFQTFTYKTQLEVSLDSVPVGALVSIEYLGRNPLGDEQFLVKLQSGRGLKGFQ